MKARAGKRALGFAVAVAVGLAASGAGAGAGAGAALAARAVWSHPLRAGPWGVAADRAGAVVVTDAPSVEALDRGGRLRWRTGVESLVEATPALGAGRVLVGGRGLVTALSRRRGTRLWQQAMSADVTSLALVGDTALAGDHSGALTAFDARTGDPRWSVRFDGRVWSAARVDAATGAVVAKWHEGPAPAVRVLDLATGALRWEAPTDVMTAAPVLRDDTVVLATGDGNRHARVEARDLATGAVRWSTPVPGSFEEAIEPAADDRDVVVVDHFGVVTLLDLATGALRWRHDVEFALIDTQMPLTPRRVVFRSFSGDVFVLDRADGHLVARYDPHDLGGYPIATVRPPWPGPVRVLVALRYDTARLDLRPLP
jgi:outer membrane protein assembly factor BamB